MSRGLVGVDVGGTKIEGVLTDARGTVLASACVPARPGDEQVVADVVRVVRRLGVDPVSIGIGVPGQVDAVTGKVHDIVNLGIIELDLAARVRDEFGATVRVENDVNAAALGAAAVCAGDIARGESIVFLNFGTGLAAGLVRDGRIEHGACGALGEIGHVPVDPNRLPCACGQRGCLETVASGGAIARLWTTDGRPPMPDLIDRAAAGQPDAIHVLSIVAHGMADVLQIAAQAYDPARILIGGGVAKTGAPLLEIIDRELESRAVTCHFLETIAIPDRLSLVPPELPVGAIGAALAVLSS